jgi:hypothetical protein
MPRSIFLPAALLLAGCSDQGFTAFDEVDSWTQNPPDEVDILLVVDDSCSMGPYQQRLGQSFDQFIEWFIAADVDYQIGVVTTDIIDPDKAGRLQGGGAIITTETENPGAAFSSLVNVGVQGAGFETGLEAARMALQDPAGLNAGFLRPDASLSIIFVSDEQDASPEGVNAYINDYVDIKGARNRGVFNASALVVTDFAPCDQQQQAQSTLGTRYMDVAIQTGGIVGNLCDDAGFEDIVFDLSLASSRLQDTYILQGTPSLETLEVRVAYPDEAGEPGEAELVPCDAGVWTYQEIVDEATGQELPAIVFAADRIPPVNSRISARYFEGDADPATFCTDAPAPDDGGDDASTGEDSQ